MFNVIIILGTAFILFHKYKHLPGQHCSTLNSTLDDYNMITKPLLPVNDGTNLTLSCSADYVNLENTTSTAECRNGTVVATSKLPKCVGQYLTVSEEDEMW